jgi:hypothetical protein
MIKHNKRIIGWDNAPHHKHLPTHPHHFHNPTGKITQSKMKDNPTNDLDLILKEAKRILKL